MKINKKLIEEKAIEIIAKHILQPQIREDLEFYMGLEYYHIVTPELAEKLSDLLYGDDYTESIGRYAYLAYYGDPVTIDFIMSLDIDESTVTEGVDFDPIDGYESLINDHFKDIFSHHGGLKLNDIGDMIKYAILCLLEEKANKKT